MNVTQLTYIFFIFIIFIHTSTSISAAMFLHLIMRVPVHGLLHNYINPHWPSYEYHACFWQHNLLSVHEISRTFLIVRTHFCPLSFTAFLSSFDLMTVWSVSKICGWRFNSWGTMSKFFSVSEEDEKGYFLNLCKSVLIMLSVL